MITLPRYRKSPVVYIVATLAVIAALISLGVYLVHTSRAADTSRFNPGNIMSDAVMSNKGTMSVQQIQAFLDSKNACNNTNVHMAAWYPHLQYSIRDGRFVCMAKESFNGRSAAQLIWQVAQDYSINPQVLIVLLEKEQGLVSDTWPNNVQYRTATGFGCPDTAPCDAQYFGLENQLRLAANLFRTVLNGGWSNYPVGHTFVQYNPNAGCGGSVIHIQNRATSALYRYTPYQPNQAALNAGYGTGDGCSAYGNRNFWMLFTDWFGDTQASGFSRLDSPRWMKLSSQTQKVNVFTGKKVGPLLSAGTQAKFVDKIYIGNQWIARTQWDQSNGNYDGIPANQLSEIAFEQVPTANVILNKTSAKYDAVRERNMGTFAEGSMFKTSDKITVNGKTYYRTDWGKQQGLTEGFLAQDVEPYRMLDFANPRYMTVKKATTKIDVITGQLVQSIGERNTYYFNKYIRLNGTTYAQAEIDNGTNVAIPFDHLVNAGTSIFYSFDDPRYMNLVRSSAKQDIFTKLASGQNIPQNTQMLFVDQVKLNNVWYARTEDDKQNNRNIGIKVEDLAEIPVEKITAKSMTVRIATRKVDPIRAQTFETIPKDSRAIFTHKIVVSGREFYLTEWEASQNRTRFIPANDLMD